MPADASRQRMQALVLLGALSSEGIVCLAIQAEQGVLIPEIGTFGY